MRTNSPTDSPAAPIWARRVPNALTALRVALAGACVALLALHRRPDVALWALPTAAAVFIVAAITDALDGHLARRWRVVSPFGRVMDPFADKILILGVFIMLAGPSFTDDAGRQITGLAAWMVVVMLARELLVTSIRGVYESMGVDFSAALSGKLKMIAQSVAAPALILLAWRTPPHAAPDDWRLIAAQSLSWIAVAVTTLSVAPYIARAARNAKGARGS